MPREIRRKPLCAWCNRVMRCKTREETEKPVNGCYMFKGKHPGAERLFPHPEGVTIIQGHPPWSPGETVDSSKT